MDNLLYDEIYHYNYINTYMLYNTYTFYKYIYIYMTYIPMLYEL